MLSDLNSNGIPQFTKFSTGRQLDAFERLKVSNPSTLFEFDFRYDQYEALYLDQALTGAATITYDANKVSRFLNTTTANGDRAILSTRRYFQYVKGKSQLVMFTSNFNGAIAGCRKRLGLFDDQNGYFYATEGAEERLVIRSAVSGAPVDINIPRASWLDPLDGSGPSGASIDIFNKQTVFLIEFSWLGSGQVNFYIKAGGETCLIHRYSPSLTVPYSQSGTLPMRAEIENFTAQGASRSLAFTCMSVSSDGGEIDLGKRFNIDTGLADINISSTEAAIFGIRLNPSFNRASMRPRRYSLFSPSGNKTIRWRILLNPILGTPVWTNNPNGGIGQFLSSSASVSGGVQLQSGYLEPGKDRISRIFEPDIYLGRFINGTSDTLVVVARTFSSNSALLGTSSWRELT